MLKMIAQIEAKVGDWVSHLHIQPETPVEIAEQLVVQYLQYLGKIKEQQVQAKQTSEAQPPVEKKTEAVIDVLIEDPKPTE